MELKDLSLITEIDEQEAARVNGGGAFGQVMSLISGIRRNPNNPILNGLARGAAHRWGVYSPLTYNLYFQGNYRYLYYNPRRPYRS